MASKLADAFCVQDSTQGTGTKRGHPDSIETPAESCYTLKELPQPQVLLTFGLLNLKPEPSIVSM
jgi:hypothetical protein